MADQLGGFGSRVHGWTHHGVYKRVGEGGEGRGMGRWLNASEHQRKEGKRRRFPFLLGPRAAN